MYSVDTLRGRMCDNEDRYSALLAGGILHVPKPHSSSSLNEKIDWVSHFKLDHINASIHDIYNISRIKINLNSIYLIYFTVHSDIYR